MAGHALGSHNQRKINAQLAARGLDKTWYDVVIERQNLGDNLEDVADHFAKEFGIVVTGACVGQWLSRARRMRQRLQSAGANVQQPQAAG